MNENFGNFLINLIWLISFEYMQFKNPKGRRRSSNSKQNRKLAKKMIEIKLPVNKIVRQPSIWLLTLDRCASCDFYFNFNFIYLLSRNIYIFWKKISQLGDKMWYSDTTRNLMCCREWAFRNRFSVFDLARNDRYVNDTRKVVQRYHLSQRHLQLTNKLKVV